LGFFLKKKPANKLAEAFKAGASSFFGLDFFLGLVLTPTLGDESFVFVFCGLAPSAGLTDVFRFFALLVAGLAPSAGLTEAFRFFASLVAGLAPPAGLTEAFPFFALLVAGLAPSAGLTEAFGFFALLVADLALASFVLGEPPSFLEAATTSSGVLSTSFLD
jgi:hypothetical protein